MQRGWFGFSLTLCLSAVAPRVGAQSSGAAPFEQNIDMQQFRPAPGPNNFLTVAGSRVAGRGQVSLGAWGSYGHRPFTIFNADCPNSANDDGCTRGTVRSRPLEHLAALDLMATVTVANRLQLGLTLPLLVMGGQAVNPATAYPLNDTETRSAFALGDPRLEAKVRITGEGLRGFSLGAAAFAGIPTGQFTGGAGSFIADGTVSLGARAIADFRTSRFFAAVNLGAVWRPDELRLLSTAVGSRLLWGAGVGVDATPRLAFLAEVFGSNDLSARQQANPVEGNLAARYALGDLALTVGGGAGLQRGAGAPVARAFVGFLWAPQRSDGDSDGVFDHLDRCPAEAEDLDGFDDQDGCPEDDNDGDGMPDATDRCPDEAEDRDQFQDQDGCPDRDNDSDGVPDGYDSCPREPEDRDGDHDEDGCPDNDRDRDGIVDEQDRCAADPEDLDGFADADGCPEPDNDEDGVPDVSDQCSDQPETRNGVEDEDGCPDNVPDRDRDGLPDDRDRCPNEPETFNGTQDDDGCPEESAPLVNLEGDLLVIQEPVNFALNSDRIVGGASFRVLDAVVALLTAHAEIGSVEIQGHTDNRGNAAANRALSNRRALAVKAYLVDHGIRGERLSALGLGPDRPLTTNDTAEGRARNRRVEFHVQRAPQ
jgi:OOP family OmpA-OmpF porin